MPDGTNMPAPEKPAQQKIELSGDQLLLMYRKAAEQRDRVSAFAAAVEIDLAIAQAEIAQLRARLAEIETPDEIG